MAITLLVLNGFSKFFSLLESQVNFQQHSYNTSHHTLAKVRSLKLWQFPKINLKIVSHLTNTGTSLVL